MNLFDRNNLIAYMFYIGMRQKVIAHEFGICERHVKRIIAKVRKND